MPTEPDTGVPQFLSTETPGDTDYDEAFAEAASRGEAPGQPAFPKQDPKKITVMLDHELWLELKHQGLAEERSGQKIMEQALREYLDRHRDA